MDELHEDLHEFINILNAECDVLKKEYPLMRSIEEPWRLYSSPLDDESKHDHLRAVLEAGRWTVAAESSKEPLVELFKAQQALLRGITTYGKELRRKHYQSLGGQKGHDEKLREKIFYMADELLESGHEQRGLAAEISRRLSAEGIDKREDSVREIIKTLQKMEKLP